MDSLRISVVDFRCFAGIEREGREEPNPTHSIVFVRRGVFRRTYRGETLLADPNYVLFFNASEPYRFSHPIAGGDECTILTVATPVALELVAQHAPRHAEHPEAPFRLSYGICSKRSAWLHYELLALVRRAAPQLIMDDVLSELTQEALRSANATHAAFEKAKPTSSAAFRRQCDLCEAVKVALNSRIDALHGLEELGRNLDCSPLSPLSDLPAIYREQSSPIRNAAANFDGGRAAGQRRKGPDGAGS